MARMSAGLTPLSLLKNGSISYDYYRDIKRRNVTLYRADMHRYQTDIGYRHIMQNEFCALFVDMGLGKTVMALTAVVDLLDAELIKKALIIAPRRVANKTWPDEIDNWDHTAMRTYRVLNDKKPEDRARAAQGSEDIHIVSRDNIEWLVMQHKSNWPYDMIIIDESSSFKDHTTKRFKALRNVRRYIKRIVELTATPVAEGYMGIFAQIFLLDEGKRFGKWITHYRERYFKQNIYNRTWKLLPGAEEEITIAIADICLVMRAEEYLDMMPLIPIERKVQLDLAQSKKYKELQETMLVQVMDEWGDDVVIEAETAASLSAKLLQICSGVVYNSYLEGINPKTGKPIAKRDVYELHSAKLDMLEEIIEECAGQNILVGYHFKSSLDRLKQRFPKGVQMDAEGECVTKWNKGKIPLLFAHPQSAGHGLNLQKGGHIIVFYDIPWSLELYLQFIGRLHRQGQTHPVNVIHLVAEGVEIDKRTGLKKKMELVDGGVVEALRAKNDGQEWMLAEISRIRQRIAYRKRREAALTEV